MLLSILEIAVRVCTSLQIVRHYSNTCCDLYNFCVHGLKEIHYFPKVDKSRTSTYFNYGRVLDRPGVLNKGLFM